jgi:hypothetical protein
VANRKTDPMSAAEHYVEKVPYAVLGAGDLVSHLTRTADESVGCYYRFSLVRLQKNGELTPLLRPVDLPDLVKVCQVLAFTIADDGWITEELRAELFALARALDEITNGRRGSQNGNQPRA